MSDHVIIDIIVSPKSSRCKITKDSNEILKVFLTSPPIDGKANKELIALFAKQFKIPKSDISIEKGNKGRNKRLRLNGLNTSEFYVKLQEIDKS